MAAPNSILGGIPIDVLANWAGLIGLSAASFVRFVGLKASEARERWTKQERAREAEQHSRILSGGLHIRFLDTLYEPGALAAQGLTKYSVSVDGTPVHTAVIGRREELHACIPVPIPPQKSFAFAEHSLGTPAARASFVSEEEAATRLTDILAKGIRIYNRQLYRLQHFALMPTSWTAVFSLDDYIAWRLSAGLLQDELFQGLIKADFDVEKSAACLKDYHPLRSRHLGPSCATFGQPNQRFAAGGAAVTCAFYRHERHDYVIPVRRRVLAMGSGAGMLGLIPQGFHQHSVSAVDEVPLTLTVFRELYEELFEGKDAEDNVNRLVGDWFLDPLIPAMAWFNTATEYRLYFTGYGSDSTAGTYDCAFLLKVDDPAYWSKFSRVMKLNWEFASNPDSVTPPWVSTRDTVGLRRLLLDPRWTPASLHSFVRGLVTLSRTAPSHVAMPEIAELDS